MLKSFPFVKFFSVTGALLLSGCCSIVIPPVTLTGNKTAIERQIIGEQTEIEENVWLISSASVSDRDKILDTKSMKEQESVKLENEYAARAFIILKKFGPDLQLLINDGVVGEAASGNLINLFKSSYNKKIPEKVAEQYNEKYMKDAIKGKKIRRLKIVVRQVNYARELLCKSYLVNQGQLEFKDSEIKKLLVQFGREKISSAKKGMIIEQSPGNWKKL